MLRPRVISPEIGNIHFLLTECHESKTQIVGGISVIGRYVVFRLYLIDIEKARCSEDEFQIVRIRKIPLIKKISCTDLLVGNESSVTEGSPSPDRFCR